MSFDATNEKCFNSDMIIHKNPRISLQLLVSSDERNGKNLWITSKLVILFVECLLLMGFCVFVCFKCH